MSRWRPYRVAGRTVEETRGFCEHTAGKLLICALLVPIPLRVIGAVTGVMPLQWAADALMIILMLCAIGGYIARWQGRRQRPLEVEDTTETEEEREAQKLFVENADGWMRWSMRENIWLIVLGGAFGVLLSLVFAFIAVAIVKAFFDVPTVVAWIVGIVSVPIGLAIVIWVVEQ